MESSNRLLRSTSDKMQNFRVSFLRNDGCRGYQAEPFDQRRLSDKFGKPLPAGKEGEYSNSSQCSGSITSLGRTDQDRIQKTLDDWLISPSEHDPLSPVRSLSSGHPSLNDRPSSGYTASEIRRRSDHSASTRNSYKNSSFRNSDLSSSDCTASTTDSNKNSSFRNSDPSSSSSYSLFPKPSAPTSTAQSIPYQQLLHQCRFLALEWATTLGNLVMIAEIGATSLEILMSRAISTGGTIAYELNELVHKFRVVHTAIPKPRSVARLHLPLMLTATRAYSLVECCRAWEQITTTLNDDFDDWLKFSPEAAVDGAKGCLGRLVAIRAAIRRLAPKTAGGPGVKDAEHDAELLLQKGAVADLKKKVEMAGAEFMMSIQPGDFSADEQVVIM